MGQNQSNINQSNPGDTTSLNLRRRKRVRESKTAPKLPPVYPAAKCKLRLMKLSLIHEYLTFEDNLLGLHDDDEQPAFASEKAMVEQLRGSPLSLGTLEEFVDDNHAIVSTGLGPEYYVPIMSFVDKDVLEPGCTVLLNYKDNSVVGVLEGETDPMVSVMKLEKAPSETYADIGGLETQIQEIKECVELPLTNPELYEEMGIRPPKGVILYGVPGTGKTLLAKAVANQTSATFLRIVGSELIQKYLGDGPKLVRELFKLADQHAPSIIFIDEIDAIGRKRFDAESGAQREIQRTMLELLNQLDGFDKRNDIKVIMATNRIEILDPALIRPGRIDRKIEFGMPDVATKKKIFEIHTAKMTLDPSVNIDALLSSKEDLNGADIKAICTEAGMSALRERRRDVSMKDFIKAREKVFYSKQGNMPVRLYS
ncbi:26S proteasome regulatory subunit 4 like protein [Astathelohania contejeani]|uniref:26S proteasome regulatory subunit 4 like protein n=1 Tax=Astathelohania contejeani TaxID=164912 RepID=A0ABQ7HZV7_9MICR|nr:26S proteasome regulatory subunit 4 like protein [Thelohania contejeani]